jgi:hypothetical protein
MRRFKVIICVVILFSLMSMRVFAIPQSDIDLLVGIGYTLLGPSLGLLSYGLLDGDTYDSSYGDYSLLAGASFITGTMNIDGGTGTAGGISWQIIRSISHSYDPEDRLFGIIALGNELSADFLVPLPLADADPMEAFYASMAVTFCHFIPLSMGANLLLYELEDGPVPFRVTLSLGDTYKLISTNEFYVRPGVDLKLFDKFVIHAEYYKTIFGRAFIGEPAVLRPSEEYRFIAGVQYNFAKKLGLRLSYVNGESKRYENDDNTAINSFAYSGIQLCFTGKW